MEHTCRFHEVGKCPKKKPMMAPKPWIEGTLEANGKVYSAKAIIRYARMHKGVAKINNRWTIAMDEKCVRLVANQSEFSEADKINNCCVIVNNYNRLFYIPSEILSDIQSVIKLVHSRLDMLVHISHSRPGVG
jgi:hypothetical protein